MARRKPRPSPPKSPPARKEPEPRAATKPDPREDDGGAPRHPSLPFPVVGIGASAGGLAAFQQFLEALPLDTGMAFVLVQHLHPGHTSMLAEILSRSTRLPVSEVVDGMRLEPNHAYVIPPGQSMIVSGGVLVLSPRKEDGRPHRVIDAFFRSLAEDQLHQSIGIILSGTASDGTLGCGEIKAAGGITFAQDDTAQHAGMPQSAVASGCVDFVYPPDELARELGRLSRHPHVRSSEDESLPISASKLASVIRVLRDGKGVDFGHYKPNTLQRRITRRMALYKVAGTNEYLRLLAGDPGEVDALFQDILINVTSFFRNPEIFEALKADVFPRLTEHRSRNDPVRIWIIGCSTGEEAYSVAMAYEEYRESARREVPLQIFASDLNAAGLEKARAGVYLKTIVQDVSPERLRRFFVEVDGSYQIVKQIRDMMVFARHNVITDPPFSRVELACCRNMLIYMNPQLQARILAILHYALNPGGYLVLGSSETVGAHRNLFDLQYPHHKIYVKRAPVLADGGKVPPRMHPEDHARLVPRGNRREAPTGIQDLQHTVDQMLLSRFAPAGVLVDAAMDIVQFRGDTAPYLASAPGRASLNLLKMLRPELLIPVRSAVQKVRKDRKAVRHATIRFRAGAAERSVDVEVIPLPSAVTPAGGVLILFDEGASPLPAATPVSAGAPGTHAGKARRPTLRQENIQLKAELAAAREYLQSVIEQQEAANEELQSANEEAQSANEELQSINEELETSKEEVQSTNEELVTVNSELNNRNQELGLINNDLVNLLACVQMSIVMLGADLRLRRFTPTAEQMFNLIDSDVGRPISDINLNIALHDLQARMQEVMDTRQPMEVETLDRKGKWFLLRIRPYETLDGRIDGVVLVLVDVDALKRVESAIRASEGRFQLLADTAPVLIWVHDLEGCQLVNRAYLEYVGAEAAALNGDGWKSFLHPDDREVHLAAYRDAISRKADFEVHSRIRRRDGEYRWMKSVGRPRPSPGGELLGYIGWSFDVTDLKTAETALREADRSKNQFLAMLAHELRGPLAPLRNTVHLLTAMPLDQSQLRWAHETMDRQISHISRMIDDLLDVSRITQGKIHLQKETLDVATVLAGAVEQVGPMIAARRQVLSVPEPSPRPMYLEGDPVRLEQIVANLLTNASKFTPPDGQITLIADLADPATHQGFVEIRVRDNGSGIAPEMLPRVFELFAQADSSLERSEGGLGIGLTLVQKLVELHGGTIEAVSYGLGKGSEFIVRLPAIAPPPEPTQADEPRNSRARKPSAWRIMVVDDNIDAGDTLSMLLRAWGHEVRVERDGTSALLAAAEYRPDIVLLDIGLPGKDGFEVARAMWQIPGVRRPILAALSGYGQEEDQRKAQEAGFDQHFTKPVNPEVLQEFLGRASWGDGGEQEKG